MKVRGKYTSSEREIISKTNFNEPKSYMLMEFCSSHKLSEDFMRDFRDILPWLNICRHQVLTENFMREMKNYLCWDFVSCYQILSDEFIEEFEDKLDIKAIGKYQRLSEKLYDKYVDKIDFWYIINLIPSDLRDKYFEKVKTKWNYFPRISQNSERFLPFRENKYFKIENGYVYGVLEVDCDNYNIYDTVLQYEVGKIYCKNVDRFDHQSFGQKFFSEYYLLNYMRKQERSNKILKVRSKVEDLTSIYNDHHVKTYRLEVLGECSPTFRKYYK